MSNLLREGLAKAAEENAKLRSQLRRCDRLEDLLRDAVPYMAALEWEIVEAALHSDAMKRYEGLGARIMAALEAK